MRYLVERMTMADIPRVAEVERIAYAPMTPWPASAYRKELEENQHAHYIVVRDTFIRPATETEPAPPPLHPRRPFPLSLIPGRSPGAPNPNLASIIGFAGLWLMLDEAHITTIAMHPAYRGRGLGELLINSLVSIAYDVGSARVTLEVRVTNSVAQNLYRKYGFVVVGTRRRYYSDNNEDAYIMTTDNINTPGYRALYHRLQTELVERLAADEQATSSPRRIGVDE